MVVNSSIRSKNEAFQLGNPPMFQWHVFFFYNDGGFTCEVEEYVKATLRAFINHLWEPKCTQARLLWMTKAHFSQF